MSSCDHEIYYERVTCICLQKSFSGQLEDAYFMAVILLRLPPECPYKVLVAFCCTVFGLERNFDLFV